MPPKVYIYADGGGDRMIGHLKVQMGLIALFLDHDLDEVIAARPAAGYSYRNPIERCHSISNLGLQSVGMMRESMDPESERVIRNLISNLEIWK